MITSSKIIISQSVSINENYAANVLKKISCFHYETYISIIIVYLHHKKYLL